MKVDPNNRRNRMLYAIGRFLYRQGFRPSGRSIFYSPSLDWQYWFKDHPIKFD